MRASVPILLISVFLSVACNESLRSSYTHQTPAAQADITVKVNNTVISTDKYLGPNSVRCAQDQTSQLQISAKSGAGATERWIQISAPLPNLTAPTNNIDWTGAAVMVTGIVGTGTGTQANLAATLSATGSCIGTLSLSPDKQLTGKVNCTGLQDANGGSLSDFDLDIENLVCDFSGT